MEQKHTFYTLTGSEGEKYFMEELKPQCKDEVIIEPLYKYEGTEESIVKVTITHKDFLNIRFYILAKRALS